MKNESHTPHKHASRHMSNEYRDPLLDTLKTVIVSSFPYNPGEDGAFLMRKELSTLCYEFDLSYLTIGVNPHTETAFITMKASNANEFVSIMNGTNHRNCIVKARVVPVSNDYKIQPWYLTHIENSKVNVNLRAVVVENFMCYDDPWQYIKTKCNSLNIRFLSTAFTNSGYTSITIVDKWNAEVLASQLSSSGFGAANVKVVKDSYSPPDWYLNEMKMSDGSMATTAASVDVEPTVVSTEDKSPSTVVKEETVEGDLDVQEVESDDDGPILQENIEQIPIEEKKTSSTFTFPLGSGSDAKQKLDFLTSNQGFLDKLSFEVSVKLVFH
jgi:hypothetical protein